MKRGFTLIELLVVIGIIAILAAILLPAMNAVARKADNSRAKADVQGLQSAWKAYYNEYGCWPVRKDGGIYRFFPGLSGEQNADEANAGSTGIVMTAVVMTNIMYPNASLASGAWALNKNPVRTNYNPKLVTFLTYRANSVDQTGNMIDPWDRCYKVMFDVNRDGKVSRPALGSLPATNVYETVIVWSTGADGIESVDDVNSWQ